MRNYIGYATYYRKFIFKFAYISNPLNYLLQKIIFKLSSEYVKVFIAIKNDYCKIVTLAYQKFSKQFIVNTDASDFKIGAILTNKIISDVEKRIAYNSETILKPSAKLLLLVKKCYHLLIHSNTFVAIRLLKHIKVRTDHSAIQCL